MVEERASKKQQELLKFVDEFIRTNGYGPSYREIMNGLGYKSVSTVAIHIDNLIAKGYLARRDKSARSLEVVGRTPQHSRQAIGTDATLKAELDKKIAVANLNSEQRVQLVEALRLIGIESNADDETKAGAKNA